MIGFLRLTLALGTAAALSTALLGTSAASRSEQNVRSDRTATIGKDLDHGGRPLVLTSDPLGDPQTAVGLANDYNSYCAWTESGNVFCWGEGAYGALGDGLTTTSSTPVEVAGASGSGDEHLSSVLSVDGGGGGFCALLTSTDVDCWGSGMSGQLGDGADSSSSVPQAVVTSSGDLTDVETLVNDAYGGGSGSGYCAALSSGGVDCWGANSYGQLGTDSRAGSDDVAAPVETDVGGSMTDLSGVASLADSGADYCALLNTGGVDCWGNGGQGGLGNGGTTSYDYAVAVSGVGGSGALSGVTSLASDGSFCALLSSGGVDCWGYNSSGDLGDGNYYQSNVPEQVLGLGGSGYLSDVYSIVPSAEGGGDGDGYCAVVNAAANVYCWGYDGDGELGDGSLASTDYPVEVAAVGGSGPALSGVSTVSGAGVASIGRGHGYCATTSSDNAFCWGYGLNGELGAGNWSSSDVPLAPEGLTSYVSEIEGDIDTYCALLTWGGIDCWGYGLDGELGNGSSGYTDVPVPVQGFIPATPADITVNPQGAPVGADLSTQCSCSSGDPVSDATGDFWDAETDLTIPAAGIPLRFTATYDAEVAQRGVGGDTAPEPLGWGWSDDLDMSLSYDSSSGSTTVLDSAGSLSFSYLGVATVTLANGAQIPFDALATDAAEPTWCPSDAGGEVFCPAAPRYLASLTLSDTTWTYTDLTGSPTTDTFSGAGTSEPAPLTETADAAGDVLQAVGSYSAGAGWVSCPDGDSCTAWESTPAGADAPVNGLVEELDGSGQLAGVAGLLSGEPSVTFSYGGEGCSSWDSGVTDVCSTDAPEGTTVYTYTTSDATPYDYDIATLDPPSTGAASNTYDSAGRVATQTITTGGVSQVTDFSYSWTGACADNGSYTTQVTTYPDGTGEDEPSDSITDYYSHCVYVGAIDDLGNTTMVLPDPASLGADDTIDANGYRSENQLSDYASQGGSAASSADVIASSDGAGDTSQFAYDADNLPICQVSPADYMYLAEISDPPQCPTSVGDEPSIPPAGTSPASAVDPGLTLDWYDSADELDATKDPLGDVTVYSYTSSTSGVPAGLRYCTIAPAFYAAHASAACPAYGTTAEDGYSLETFDAQGNVLTSANPDGDETQYSYGSTSNPGLPTEVVDPDGSETTYTYNSMGEPLTETVADPTEGGYGATTQHAYDAGGRQWCEVSPYDYALGTRCPDSEPSTPPSGTTGYTDTIYDADGEVTSTTNPLGGTTEYAYDGDGNRYCSVAPAQYAAGTRCPSLPFTTPTTSEDAYLGATITSYDGDGRVTQVTNPLGGITLTSYDPAGNVAETTVESGQTGDPNVVTAYSYDGDDRVVSTTVGSGSSTATTVQSYDPDGNVYCSVSADAYAAGTSAYQCPAWQASWAAAPPKPASLYSTSPSPSQADDVTTTFYDADGNVLQATDPDVHTTVSAYDADGQQYCKADPTNVAAYLAAHRSATYPYLCPTSPPTSAPSTATGYVTTIYDAAGRTTSTTDQLADTTSYTYAPGGEVLTTTDPRGKVTTDCYYYEDASGQCAHGATAADGSFDDLYTETTPATSADPSGETTTSTYFPGGLADTTTTPAGATTDGYDALGDLTSVTYSATASGYTAPPDVSSTYNVDGSTATTTDGTGTTTYSYDAAGDELTQALTPATDSGLSARTLSYAYFKTRALETVTYPAYGSYSSPAASYTYDGLGDMASVTDWLGNEVAFSSDGDGNETAQDNAVSGSYPSGTSSTEFSFDAADQLTSAITTEACSGSGTLTQSFAGSSGSRNADGQVTEDEESYGGGCSGSTYERNYSYDAAGRVVYQGSTAQGSEPDILSYDASGDPTEISESVSGSFDTYDQTFDSAGEVTGQSPVSGSGGSSSSYTYDTFGDLASATTGSSTTSYSYDQTGRTTALSSSPVSGATVASSGDGLEASVSGWAPPDNVDGTHTLVSVSCASSSFCAAGDDAGNVLVWNGTSWSASNLDGAHTLEAMSCPTTSFCAAVDNDGNLLTYNGTSWTSPTSIDGTTAMSSVSCTTASDCTAVDNSGNVLSTTNGWSTHTTTNEDSHALDSVSCASALVCAAVDDDGNVVSTTNDWASGSVTTTDIDSTTHLGSMACPTTTFCVAVDNSGNAITGNPTTASFGSATSVDGTNLLESVTCTSASDCIAVDVDGNVVSYDGTNWTPPLAVDSATLRGLSCASATFCVAVDHQGDVAGFDGAGLTQLTWSSMVASLPSVVSDGTWDYVYGPADEPVEQVNITSSPPSANPQFLTYTPDDSSWLVSSPSGSQLAFYRYDAFGSLALGTPASTFGYAGQYAGLSANANGLDDMRARQYQPQTGEFTTRDPLFASTDEAYAYAGGDPVNGGDPSGLGPPGVYPEGGGNTFIPPAGCPGLPPNPIPPVTYDFHDSYFVTGMITFTLSGSITIEGEQSLDTVEIHTNGDLDLNFGDATISFPPNPQSGESPSGSVQVARVGPISFTGPPPEISATYTFSVGSAEVEVVHSVTTTGYTPRYPKEPGVVGAVLTWLGSSAGDTSGSIGGLDIPTGVLFVIDGLGAAA